MNDEFISSTLISKSISEHAANRYLKFIAACRASPVEGYSEVHHVLPQAGSCWPEFANLSDNKWNAVRLTARQHLVAHWMLSKALGGSMTVALMMMCACNKNGVRINSRMYAEAKTQAAKIISQRRRGKTNGHLGMKRSQESKTRMAAAQLGKKHTAEAIANMSAAKTGQLAGIPKSAEHRASLSLSATGRVHTQESKDKISQAFKGVVLPLVTCPHCSKEGAGGAMKQWHFDKCKFKNGEPN